MNLVLAASVCAMLGSAVNASAYTIEAFDNATIQPAGPRSGASGKAFFNIEGDNNGSFASYGVARFDGAATRTALDLAYGSGQWRIDSVELLLTQSNASFTTNGALTIAYTADDSADIQPGTSGLQYPVAGDFADMQSVGDFNFVQVATGAVDSYLLYSRGVSASAGAMSLLQDLLTDDVLTLLLTEGDASVAATYAGYSNFTYDGPTLSVVASPVPVPAALPLIASAIGLLAVRRGGRVKQSA
ncbi:MAG: hypothetical protein H6978_08735 [Gammaproteobacteria bacterium]|nr:hypothetical protein [Gammaproteobacteria bacterium]